MSASVTNATRSIYKQAVDKYSSFVGNSRNLFPISVSNMAKFIAKLYLSNYKASTISTLIAGLSYCHSLSNLPNPANHILIKKLLKGASKLTKSPDVRLPISREILKQMIESINRIYTSTYEIKLYSAVLSLAFHALLRVGEYTKTGTKDQHTLLRHHVHLLYKRRVLSELQLTIPHYKHSARPVTLSIQATRYSTICPVMNMQRYLQVRTSKSSNCLFVNAEGKPISSYTFSSVFRTCIEDLGLDGKVYKPHSLRIGGASLAHQLNFSDAQIESLGRWHSNSYKRYIRIPVLSANC